MSEMPGIEKECFCGQNCGCEEKFLPHPSGALYEQDPLPGMSIKELTEIGVVQIQNGVSSIDEVRERLDLPPWGLPETSEPVVFTAQGPVPFSMAPQLFKSAEEMTRQEKRIKDLETLVLRLLEQAVLQDKITRSRRELGL